MKFSSAVEESFFEKKVMLSNQNRKKFSSAVEESVLQKKMMLSKHRMKFRSAVRKGKRLAKVNDPVETDEPKRKSSKPY